MPTLGPAVDDRMAQDERVARLRAALDTLSSKQRTVVILHDLEGLAVEEVAGVVGAGIAAVRSRLRDGRKALARALAQDPYFGDRARLPGRRRATRRGGGPVTLHCIDLVMGEALRRPALARAGLLRPEHVEHLDGCKQAAGGSSSNGRRVAVAWQAIEPGHAELRAARSRFLGRGRRGGDRGKC